MPQNLSAFISYMSLLAQLIDAGKTSIIKIRGFLQQEGATPEQLAELDARLTDAINKRESERP